MKLNRDLSLWYLYDFANSLAFINITFYYPLVLTQDLKLSQFYISLSLGVSTVLLILTLPILGKLADQNQSYTKLLKVFTIISIACLFLLAATIYQSNKQYFSYLSIVLFTAFYYFYQASIAFYSSYLNHFSINNSKEKISGLGMLSGQLGNVFGLAITIPVVNGTIKILSFTPRQNVFLIASIIFLISVLPFLFYFKPKMKENTNALNLDIKNINFKVLLQVIKNKPVFLYLIAFYLFADSILTLQIFGSTLLDILFRISDQAKNITLILGIVFASLGALISYKINKIYKSTYLSIKIMVLMLAFSMFMLAFSTNGLVFRGIVILTGFVFGVLFSLSRSYYSDISPKDKQAQYFSIYVLFERVASVLGPLVWSSVISLAAIMYTSTHNQYRIGVISLGVMVLFGYIVLQLRKEAKK